MTCSCRRLPGNKRRVCAWCSGRTRRSPGRRSTRCSSARRGLRHSHAGEQGLGSGDRGHSVSPAGTAEPQALGALARVFAISAPSWTHAQADCCARWSTTGVSCSLASLHRGGHGPSEPLGRPVLQQAWHGGAMDQGRQWKSRRPTGRPVVVPSFPGERSAPSTERPGLQPGQFCGADRPAATDRALVADKSSAAAGRRRGAVW